MVAPDPSSDASGGPSPQPAPRSSAQPTLEPQAAFRELAQLVVGDQPLGKVLSRVAELARACLPGSLDISVTLIEGEDRATTVGFTGPLASTLDERQYEGGFGPCIDAAHSGQTIRIDDTTSHNPYEGFTEIAARQGVRSIVSVGMPMPQRLVGGLNVYVYDDAPLDDEALELLQVFGGYAAIALANHSLYAASLSLSTHLQVALKSRAVIEQAKGILIAQTGCTPEEAFAMLAERSQRENRKLRDVAVEVTGEAQRR